MDPSYSDIANAVAVLNPTVQFPGVTYYDRQYENVIGILMTMHEGAYICGMMASGISQTGKAGFIGAFAFPSQIALANAFYLGANKTYSAWNGSGIDFTGVWTGDWSDLDLGREAAISLLGTGVDVALGRGDLTLGAISAFSAVNDTWFFGDLADQTALASDTVVASSVVNFTVTFLDFEEKRLADTLTNATLMSLGMAYGENVIIRNPGFSDAFINAQLSNLTAWIAAETTAILNNDTQIPWIPTQLW